MSVTQKHMLTEAHPALSISSGSIVLWIRSLWVRRCVAPMSNNSPATHLPRPQMSGALYRYGWQAVLNGDRLGCLAKCWACHRVSGNVTPCACLILPNRMLQIPFLFKNMTRTDCVQVAVQDIQGTDSQLEEEAVISACLSAHSSLSPSIPAPRLPENGSATQMQECQPALQPSITLEPRQGPAAVSTPTTATPINLQNFVKPVSFSYTWLLVLDLPQASDPIPHVPCACTAVLQAPGPVHPRPSAVRLPGPRSPLRVPGLRRERTPAVPDGGLGG